MNQGRIEGIHTPVSPDTLYHCKALFLNYNISYKLLSNKEILVPL